MSEERGRRCAVAAVVFLLALPVCAALAADAATTDTATFARLMAKAWSRDRVFERVKKVCVADGTLYVLGAPRGLDAIDPATGITRWLHVGRYPVDTPPTRLEGVVSFAEGGELVGIDEKTGLEKSRTKIRVGVRTPVYPHEDYWTVASGDDRVYGLSPTDGRRLWHVTINDLVTGSDWRAENPEVSVFMTRTGTLTAVDLDIRGIAWQTPFRKPECSAPTLAPPLVFVGCEDYYLYALSVKSGLEQWKVCLSAPVLEKPVAAHGRVYATTADGVLHAVDIERQEVLWANPQGGRVLTATEEWVVLHRRTKELNLIAVADAATGKVTAQATARDHEYFAADPTSGIFIAANERGDVLAIGVRKVVEAQAAARAARASERLSQTQSRATTPTPPSAGTPAASPATVRPAAPAPAATPTTTAKPSGGGPKYFLVH